MAQQETSSLKTWFDELAETDGDKEFKDWVIILLDNKTKVADCVTRLLEGHGPGKYVQFHKAKNSQMFSFDIPNQVHTLEYLRQNTTIPLPTVHSWATNSNLTTNPAASELLEFGPFIIMGYIEGTSIATILKQPDQEGMLLNPDIDKTILDKVYRQIADYMLQISHLRLPRIGAISKDEHGNWSTRRPLTYNINELVTVVADFPNDRFPTTPMDRASEYFKSAANQHLDHLHTQRNIAIDEEIARKRFIARHQSAQLISKYCMGDTGPFIPFCDDMRPSNMLVNPETLQITAVIDFEFTNSLPAQFAYDPPWWLLLTGPETWLDRCPLEKFLALYEPRLEQFLQALEHVEAESPIYKQNGELCLSARMWESWQTRRFWFDYAARKSFEVDGVYWAMLHEDGATIYDDQARADMEPFVQRKMEQLKAYNEECDARFSKPSEDS